MPKPPPSNGLSNGHHEGQSSDDLASQLAFIQKQMAQQQAQMKAQQEALDKEREERQRKEEELKFERQERQRLESGRQSQLTNNGDMDEAGSVESELDALKRRLTEREAELKEKDEMLKEREERLSVLTQRSDSNLSGDTDYLNGFNPIKPQSGQLPSVHHSICQCTVSGHRRCILYKRDVCNCSYSCQFVKEYFKPPRGQSFFMA